MMEILNHTFIKKLSSRCSIFILNLRRTKKIRDGFNPIRELFYHEKYLSDIFLSISEVESILHQLNISIVLMSNFRNTTIIKANSISRFDLLIYHIENYYFRLTGLLDRLLRIVKLVLIIEIKEEDIIHSRFLINNKGKKGQHALKIIERNPHLFEELVKFQAFVNIKRELRDNITHTKRYKEENFSDIEMIDLVMKHDNEFTEQMKYFYKHESDLIIRTKKNELENEFNNIISFFDNLYSILEKEFDKQYKVLILKHYKEICDNPKSILTNYQYSGLTEDEIKVVEGE